MISEDQKIQKRKSWINALFSGQYKQGFGSVHTPSDNSFCAFGVLFDIHSWQFGASVMARKIVEEFRLIDKILELNDAKKRDFNFIGKFLCRVFGFDYAFDNETGHYYVKEK